MYGAEEFLAGEPVLLPIEQEELKNIEGKKLLDLQCFVGVHTLSWARNGATVIGVDISAEAIELSRRVAAKAGLETRANFIEANVYDLLEIHSERYDVVFTNFGVLCWLPDIERWAEVVTEFLKPGGTFYIAGYTVCRKSLCNRGPDSTQDFSLTVYHPMADALSYDFASDGTAIRIEHPYFSTEPPTTGEDGPPYKWTHGLGER